MSINYNLFLFYSRYSRWRH